MIRVLVVDDSAVVRKLLTEELGRQPDIEVVGTAMNPYVAREKIAELRPDVITLDLEMPKMDGLSFLAKLMKHHPMPVVVVSSLTPKNSKNALTALKLGAVDVICKPGSAYSTQNISQHIIQSVRTASRANFDNFNTAKERDSAADNTHSVELHHTTDKIVAIGSSTGGTRALEAIIPALPPSMPGTVIVQHMPPVFTKSFAVRLNEKCLLEVKEAEDGEQIRSGHVYIAPGNFHMLIEKKGAKYFTRIKKGPPVHHQRPSVDVLFNSVAKAAGVNATGIILTGMGADGARGLLKMKSAGAHTIAQDEGTCVVYGMPKEACELGAVESILPLHNIAPYLVDHIKKQTTQPVQG